ncbi:MAG TPA: hypothetical protein VK543_03855 [Puia sp.]|nr:hypothetical protein [Puia sp.]
MFKVGTVIRIFAEEARPNPKVKYVIIVGSSSDSVGFIFINSEVNPNHLNSANLQALHYPIVHTECPYLDEDESYADCSEIFERPKSDLNTLLQKEPGRIQKPPLTAERIESILDIIRRAKTIPPADKKKFGII